MYQLIIIGSGPAGLTAGIYAGRAGLNTLLLAGTMGNGRFPGGQLVITTEVENYPGFPDGISGPELVENMFAQAKRFGITIVYEDASEIKIDKTPMVRVEDEWISTDAIIIATGSSAKWLNIPGEEEFKNNGISACATCDGPLHLFRNKILCVVGGGDTACEEALFLTQFASHVYIIHRRDSLRASQIMINRVLNHTKITVQWNTTIVECCGDEVLDYLILDENGTLSKFECSGLFVAIGHEKNTTLLNDCGIKMIEGSCKTNIPGIFVAGDINDSVYRQAITASAFGCQASIEATRFLAV